MILLILMASVILLGMITWFFPIFPFIGFIGGSILSLALSIVLLRKLSQWAVKSALAWGIVASILGVWLATSMTKSNRQTHHTEPAPYREDAKDIMTVLKQYGFRPANARDAADFALSRQPHDSLEEKVRLALQYLGSKNKSLFSNERAK